MRVTFPQYCQTLNKHDISFAKSKKQQPSLSQEAKNRETAPAGIFSIPSNIASIKAINRYKKEFTPEAEAIYDIAVKIAKAYKSPTVEAKHLWLASLIRFDDLIGDIEKGKMQYDPAGRQKFALVALQEAGAGTDPDLSEPRTVKKIKKVTEKHIDALKKYFEKESSRNTRLVSSPLPSKNLIKELNEISLYMQNRTNVETFYDSYFYILASNSLDAKLQKFSDKFNLDLAKALMIDDDKEKINSGLNLYDKKAQTMWKSMDMGEDLIVLGDAGNEALKNQLVESLQSTIKDSKTKYRKLDPNNTEIINLSDLASFKFLGEIIPQITKANEKTGKTTVFVGNLLKMLNASLILEENAAPKLEMQDLMVLKNKMQNGEKNPYARLVLVTDSATYYANTKSGLPLSNMLTKFAIQTLPVVTSNDAKEILTNENGMEYTKAQCGKPVDSEAIVKAVELTNDEKGYYPDKAINLLNKVSKYFVDEDSINADHVSEYIRETQKLTEISNNEENVDIVYDTGKTLDDIVGCASLKETAKSIVNEIKNGMKTKGFLIYQSNYRSDGGGRKNTIQAIAGEAHIPMISIDAKEFLMKDLSSLYQDPNLAELKVKTLFTKIKAQAKTTQNKTAVVYIENFDNFATDPYKGYYPGNYEQKAFSQLLLEMEKARKEDDVNLIVVGSVNNRGVIDNNIRKPGKFMDEIVVYPPQDKNERKDVINYYVKKMNLDIDGDIEKQQETIDHIALTTGGFSVVDMMYLLESAKSVSIERQKSAIDRADFTEAYLRIQYGRTNKSEMSSHKKQIVSSHEAGHALVLQVMYDIAKRQNTPWKLPNKVNFITLDPRGYYGGAMYPMESGNEEYSFEKIMADLVCDYGGHSAEKTLYDYTGSWGITADMEMAREMAHIAVVDMGMGAKTGVRHIKRNWLDELDVSEKQKQKIEEDEEAILSGAEMISNKILEEYKDFVEKFTKKHYTRVGTGDCIITSEEFNRELNEWKNSQSEEKQESLRLLENSIITALEKIKHGEQLLAI